MSEVSLYGGSWQNLDPQEQPTPSPPCFRRPYSKTGDGGAYSQGHIQSHGQNTALAVLHVPYSLDSG